jgi:hypothetical protein
MNYEFGASDFHQRLLGLGACAFPHSLESGEQDEQSVMILGQHVDDDRCWSRHGNLLLMQTP